MDEPFTDLWKYCKVLGHARADNTRDRAYMFGLLLWCPPMAISELPLNLVSAGITNTLSSPPLVVIMC